MTRPFIKTRDTFNDRAKDWLIALIPVIIWSVYIFGARVLTLVAVGGISSLALDVLVLRFVFKRGRGARVDLMAFVYGVLACFAMPVCVPLWMPAFSAFFVVLAKNLKLFGRRIFNPFILSAFVLNVAFEKFMTVFTRPFAYFSATDITIDERLISGYRVISPLQYISDGSVYEDGTVPQLFGFASGALGEIAVAAMLISLIYLLFRKEADILPTGASLFVILVLSLTFPSSDAESNFFAYSILFSGAVFFISVFALNERHTTPMTRNGRALFGILCGCLIFASRKFFGGYEWGYLIVLVLNVISPIIEKLTLPKPYNALKSRKKS